MAVAAPARRVESHHLGQIGYGEALELQTGLVRDRREGRIGDRLLLLEHPHVITVGSAGGEGHILADERRRAELGIELHPTGRGGDVTYHGPGQLVGYPILDLKPDRKDLHRYLRDLEEVLIGVVGSYGIEGWRAPGFTGVWTAAGKIAAIGVRVSSGWITSHGFALNVGTDLSYFETIVPCGLEDRRVTSIEALTGRPIHLTEVMGRVEEAFAQVFRWEVVPGERAP